MTVLSKGPQEKKLRNRNLCAVMLLENGLGMNSLLGCERTRIRQN